MNNKKMIIRSVTYTIDLTKMDDTQYLEQVSDNISTIKKRFNDNDITIRTIRFNILNISKLSIKDKDLLFNRLNILSEYTKKIGLRWFNISFDLINATTEQVDFICETSIEIIKNYKNSFVNVLVAKEYINNYAAYKASDTISKISKISKNGIDNFRFGISLNIEPNTPFFPFSYSNCNDSFSLAVETTQNVINTIKENFNHDYIILKEKIINNMQNDLQLFDTLSKELMKKNNIKYNGQDISLSPYPDEDLSVIEILNLLGIDQFGSNGTQFLTSYLTSILKDTMKRFNLKSVGFNGVMYSLLEDHLMCKSHDKKNFTIDSIILYSTVCGCGLDMVPLPGDTLKEEISSMVLDVATTSIKLNKPLGVRVLPIPEKKSNDITELKLDFLTNTLIPEVKHIHIDSSLFKINKFYVKEQ